MILHYYCSACCMRLILLKKSPRVRKILPVGHRKMVIRVNYRKNARILLMLLNKKTTLKRLLMVITKVVFCKVLIIKRIYFDNNHHYLG